jgi:hypothetical protein
MLIDLSSFVQSNEIVFTIISILSKITSRTIFIYWNDICKKKNISIIEELGIIV